MNRRRLLKGAAAVGAAAGLGALGRYALIAPPRSERLDSVDELAVRIFEALPPTVRSQACVGYDHPLRQCHNRGLGMGGASVNAASFDWDTRCALTDLLHSGLSEVGRSRLPNQDATRWAGVNLMQMLVCGDPRTGPYQIVLSGVHLNLRLGGASPDGAAFGGPQVYGDQRGNEVAGLPGNVYRYQMEAAHRLIGALTPAERAAVRVPYAPAQVNIGVQGRAGRFDGVPVADLAAAKRGLALEAIDPEVVGELAVQSELRVVEAALQVFHGLPPPRELGVLGAFRHLVDLVVVRLASEHGLLDRTELQLVPRSARRATR